MSPGRRLQPTTVDEHSPPENRVSWRLARPFVRVDELLAGEVEATTAHAVQGVRIGEGLQLPAAAVWQPRLRPQATAFQQPVSVSRCPLWVGSASSRPITAVVRLRQKPLRRAVDRSGGRSGHRRGRAAQDCFRPKPPLKRRARTSQISLKQVLSLQSHGPNAAGFASLRASMLGGTRDAFRGVLVE